MNPLHLSSSCERYTPREYAEALRRILGGAIELDVASCARANRVVRARHYFTARSNALTRRWRAQTVYCNPPGESTGRRVQAFWTCMVEQWLARVFETGIWAGFNLGQLQSLQGLGVPAPQRFTLAFPARRICWLDATLTPLTQPGHGNYFALLTTDRGVRARFHDVFESLGEVTRARKPVRRAA